MVEAKTEANESSLLLLFLPLEEMGNRINHDDGVEVLGKAC